MFGLPSSLFMNLFCALALSSDPRSQYCNHAILHMIVSNLLIC